MKKIFLLMMLLFICSCANNNDVIDNVSESVNEKKADEMIKYADDNPIRFSFYQDGINGGFDILTDEYQSTWVKKKDIVVFMVLYGNESHYNYSYFQDAFGNLAKDYENYMDYKIGWNVSFKTDKGDINKTILKPSDVNEFYDYLEIYLYDSFNIAKDTWYSHLLDDEVNEKTKMTSIKLTAGSMYESIISDITVSAFTYKNSDDFDENNNYRGNSFNTIVVSNK